jgi:hypothetical protein
VALYELFSPSRALIELRFGRSRGKQLAADFAEVVAIDDVPFFTAILGS